MLADRRHQFDLADERDPCGLIRDAINATYVKADVEGNTALRVLALTMMAHLAKARETAGIPQYRNPTRSGRA